MILLTTHLTTTVTGRIQVKIVSKLLFANLLILSTATKADGQIPTGEIGNLYFHAGHSGLLIKHDHLADPDNCGRADWFILPNTHPHAEKIYSLLLSAQIANKKVSLFVSGCHEGIPAIKHIALAKS